MTIENLYKPKFHKAELNWINEPAYIIGGGPSLIGFDFDRLRGRNTIAVKSAAEYLPWADFYFSMDSTPRLMKERLQRLSDANFLGEIVIAVKENYIAPCPVSEVKFIIRDNVGKKGLSIWRDRVYGFNSGYSAINYAFLKGANPIYLLGLDFIKGGYWYDPNSTHWIDPRIVDKKLQTRDQYIAEMEDDFQSLADHCKRMYVDVYNTGGSLKVFPMVELNSL